MRVRKTRKRDRGDRIDFKRKEILRRRERKREKSRTVKEREKEKDERNKNERFYEEREKQDYIFFI